MRSERPARGSTRWPLGPRPASTPPPSARAAAALLVVGAVLLTFAPWEKGVRVAAALGLVVLAGVVHRLLSRAPDAGPWLVLDELGLRRADPGSESLLVSAKEPFGVTVLTRPDRKAVALALTSLRATRFLPVAIAEGEPLPARLAELATPAAEGDLPEGRDATIAAEDAEQLVAAIAAHDPAALERVMLVDAQGEPVVLDRTELRVGGRRIDLGAALEWKAFVFQERGSLVVSLVQATWVRQGDVEVVFVAPVPDVGWVSHAPHARLAQGQGGDPPPRELRRAIDHLFMAPLRRALERAPRISRAPSSPAISRPEGRA